MSYAAAKAAAVEAKATIELTPTYIEFKEKGQEIIGKYLGRAQVTGKLSEIPYYQYTFNTDRGNVKFHLGASSDKEIGTLLVEGKVYSLTFEGETKITGGRRVRKFLCLEIPMDVAPPVDGKKDDGIPI